MARPLISEQPPPKIHIAPGGNASITFAVLSGQSFHWKKGNANVQNNSVISGASGNISGGANYLTLTFTEADSTYAADYYCEVTNGSGSSYTNPCTLRIDNGVAPVITTQPQSAVNVAPGSTVNLVADATSNDGDVAWRWYIAGTLGNTPIGDSSDGSVSGTTSRTLVIRGASAVNAATYFAEATNNSGTATTASASVTIKGAMGTNPYEQPPGSGGGIIVGGNGVLTGGTLQSGLSLSAYSTRLGGSCLAPYFHPSLLNRLIPQDGAQFSKGDHGEDIFNLPYKIARVGNWLPLIPRKGSSLSDFPSMYLWDPQRTGSTKGPMASVNLIYKGLADGTLPNAIVTDDTTLASVSVQAENGGSLEYSYYAPRSVYRYIVQGDPQGVPKYTSVRNSSNRPIRIYRSYFKSGNDDGDNTSSDFYQPLFVNQSEINVSTRSEQMGGYWLCDDEAVKSLVNPYSAS